MKRRNFLASLAGLLAAPSLIERIKPAPVELLVERPYGILWGGQDAYEAYYSFYSVELSRPDRQAILVNLTAQ